jgi:hypothetical protein
MMFGRNGDDMAEGNRHQTRRRSPRFVAAAVMATMALGAAACSSGTTAATTTTGVPVNPATAPADIAAAYNTLFHFTTGTLASKIALVQDGPKLSAALNGAKTSSEASAAAGTKVNSTNLLTASQCQHVTPTALPYPCAHLNYDILGPSGAAILPGNNGYAVYSNGKWLVAKTTICTLLGLLQTASGKTGSPPGC